MPDYIKKDNMTFSELLLSKEWSEYFSNLSKTLNFEFHFYDEDGINLFSIGENKFCKFIESAKVDSLSCSDSCIKLMFESLKAKSPSTYKCPAGIMNFSFPVERFDEKIYIRGIGGFASYDAFLDFLRSTRETVLPPLPATMPLNFIEEDSVSAIANYVYLTVNKLLNTFDEKYRVEEKLLRMTSLFDSHTFATLSKNPDLLHRYILDTIEFVLGKTSATIMVLDHSEFIYKSTYSTGTYKDDLAGFQLDAKSPLVHNMFNTRTFVFSGGTEKHIAGEPLKKTSSFLFFPIFIGDTIEKIIGIFDRSLSREDLKIMNAFRDYLQLNLENHNLRFSITKMKRSDEKLAYIADFSNSIAAVLGKERLFNTLLEKTLQYLHAEQGSVMLLDHDTSELVVEARKGADDAVQEKMRLKKEESIAGKVIESGEPLLVEDIEKDPRVKRENRSHYKTKSFISIMIKIEDRVTGVINVSDKIRGDAFTDEDLKLLQSFVSNAAIAIERSLLYKQTEELKQLSITDPLTGIYNRRYLNTRLSEEITRYNRYKHPFSFMMLDMDKFKEYNDTFGHILGDKLIKALATIMEKSLRNVDIAARFGGDEFVAIFPQTTKTDAIHITHRLKEKIDKALHQETLEIPVTVSMGLTTYPDDASSIGELLEKTDQALYLAKRGGGDKVVYL
ncbi:MAG: diguanylate cyclase [Nitrospirae bacterium]|nr:diguanylate cyclase [Nitrospirota bacterium]